MTERRFTDREVARILERASDLDRRATDRPALPGEPPGLAPGLTVAQLQEIGVEAGISPDLIARAAAELDRPSAIRMHPLLGASPVNRETRSVPGRLSRDDLAGLVRVVDRRIPAQGSVSEALGSVRWASGGRFLDRQVVLEPREGETLVQVEERFSLRVPGLLQGLPAAYGLVFGSVGGSEWLGGGVPGALVGALVLGLTAWLLGRLVWAALARRSAARTHGLAEELAQVAGRVLGAVPPEGFDDE